MFVTVLNYEGQMLQHSRPTIDAEDVKAVTQVLQSGYIAQGLLVEEFENRFRKFLGVEWAVATNSGSSALHLSLLALGVGRGDEVILPSYVCVAVLNAVRYVGAEAKLCDICEEDLNLRVRDIKKEINKRTRAIILTHTFGQPADIEEFLGLGIPIIEDCAQSLGAKYKGKRIGSLGAISIFSFYATKMIATGHGGMVASDSQILAQKIRDFREFDERQNYKVRYNYKMSDIEASLGLSQIAKLDTFISKRKEIAQIYDEAFSGYGMEIPHRKERADHIFYRYVIKVESGLDKIITRLARKGIEAKRPIYKPLHQYLVLDKRNFPNTEEAYNSLLSLPIYPSLGRDKAEFIARTVGDLVFGNDLSRTPA